MNKKSLSYLCLAIVIVYGGFYMCFHTIQNADSPKSSGDLKVQKILNEPERISESELRRMVSNRDYKKACEVKEFSTAYEIVDELKEETAEARADWKSEQGFLAHKGTREALEVKYHAAEEKSRQAEKYVILQESLFVLESEDPNSLVRIVGIAKEHNAEYWLYSELIDIAEKVGNNELVEKLKKMNEKNENE